MESRDNIINRDLIIGWGAIVLILFVAYIGEVIKGERTWLYLLVFMIFTGVPALFATLSYRKNPGSHNLRYNIIVGYMMMYIFVMLTGNTTLVFTYIFPLLSLLVLYHQENIILYTGMAALVMNVVFVLIRILNNEITISNSKDVEIQFALLFLCFAASYAAAKLYGKITKRNLEYMERLSENEKQIKKMTFQSIMTIANTIDAKDEYTKGHSQRVAEYSCILAKELGLSEEKAEEIREIALLHDIGKIGVPDSVLNKPGKLTDEEYAIMKLHPVVGAEILKDIQILDNLDVGAKYHHERYDGRGYPEGLKGDSIPFIARIIGVADAYDAMSSNRVYRRRLSDEKILEELEKSKGTQFDPRIADAFINLIKSRKLKLLSPDRRVSDGIRETPQESFFEEPFRPEIEERRSESTILDELRHNTGVENRIVQTLKKNDGCILLVDLDDTGEINRKYGYHRGDYYLTLIAEALTGYKEKLLVSRIEGDEFLCFMSDVDSIMEAEEKVIELMNFLHTSVNQYEEGVTLSVGVSLSVVSGRDYTRLFLDADKALYHVKQIGKNGFYIFSDVVEENQHENISKQDLDNLVRIIQEEYSYTGAFKMNYREFEKVYEFVRNIGKRNAQTVQLILFTVSIEDEKNFTIDDRNEVMQYVEDAIIETVRNVDITTRYSSTQQLVMFINLDKENIQMIIDRIMKQFFRMYDKKHVKLTYDVANLDFEKKDNE